MSNFYAYYDYVISRDTRLFTVIMLPSKEGKFPCIITRSPYVDGDGDVAESELCQRYLSNNEKWMKHGYAVISQHCRGRGKSEGDCIPYINERDDSRALYDWVREQDFYNGEMFFMGTSYLSSVHYCAAPYGEDVKGALFNVQDSERYNICYRNGFLKKALHCDWYVGMYKAKSKMKKHYTKGSFETLPLSSFTKTVFGESAEDFDEMLRSPSKDDPFWQTHNGGADARGATDNVKFPILFTTAFYDIYTGGIFDMWNKMSPESRERSALVVSPYSHGDGPNEDGIAFPDGRRVDGFGEDYDLLWFEHIRGKGKSPFEKGKVTYYCIFENRWRTDGFEIGEREMTLPLGDGEVTYTYNPYDPPRFKGGLSCNFGGSVFQDPPNSRHDIISVYTEPFESDTLVKGKMTARLRVSSDCCDTCFYMRVSIEKERGDYGLRDDITSLCYQLGDYTPNTPVDLSFSFDEHAFLIKKGERLRIDIASADAEHYVRHTNQKGLFSEQETAKIARNTLYLQYSTLTLPICED
ncbi:MAG: CocE/NonD family hydrolase [Clostridia bacterium]|nr:CocE/NonD family hydrolase [Clostridia bacterium]